MNKICVLILGLLAVNSAYADINLTCDDERSNSEYEYEAKIDIKKSKVTISTYEYEVEDVDNELQRKVGANGKEIISASEVLTGKFKNCAVTGAANGSVLDGQNCDFVIVRNGEEENLGSISFRENGSASYNMNLMDRNFRGSCR